MTVVTELSHRHPSNVFRTMAITQPLSRRQAAAMAYKCRIRLPRQITPQEVPMSELRGWKPLSMAEGDDEGDDEEEDGDDDE